MSPTSITSNFTVPRPQDMRSKATLKQEFTGSDHNETSVGEQSFIKVAVKTDRNPAES